MGRDKYGMRAGKKVKFGRGSFGGGGATGRFDSSASEFSQQEKFSNRINLNFRRVLGDIALNLAGKSIRTFINQAGERVFYTISAVGSIASFQKKIVEQAVKQDIHTIKTLSKYLFKSYTGQQEYLTADSFKNFNTEIKSIRRGVWRGA